MVSMKNEFAANKLPIQSMASRSLLSQKKQTKDFL